MCYRHNGRGGGGGGGGGGGSMRMQKHNNAPGKKILKQEDIFYIT